MIAVALPFGLAFLMFGVGLRLTIYGMAGVLRHPAPLITGLAVQLIALPLCAMFLAGLLALPPHLAAGLVIIAVSPGGITSNYIALLARADIALSALMTLVTSLSAVVTIPAALWLTGHAPQMESGGAFGPLARLAIAMTLVSAVPLLAGMAFKRWFAPLTLMIATGVDRASRFVFLAIVIATFIENWGAMTMHLASVGLACAMLNLAGLLLGYGAGIAFGFNVNRRLAIAIEAGLQNAAVAIFVATSIFGDPALAIPALIYAVFMNFSALAVIALRRQAIWRTP